MRTLTILLQASIISFSVSPCSFAEQTVIDPPKSLRDAGWVRLFDGKSFDGWYTYLQRHKKNEDPTKVFQIHDGMIHVYKDQPDGSDTTYGYLATEPEYENFHLRMEYKWGEKKFRPRAAQRRDAGLLYHVVPPDAVWPRCIECQIQENDVGDCFTVRGTQVVASVEKARIETLSGPKMLPRYKSQADGGKPQKIGDGSIARIVKSSTHERDGWNTVEIIVQGGDVTRHIVNGHTVFEATNLRQRASDRKTWEPLTHGHIALQAEFAEVYYRNIEIRPIPEGPLQRPTTE